MSVSAWSGYSVKIPADPVGEVHGDGRSPPR